MKAFLYGLIIFWTFLTYRNTLKHDFAVDDKRLIVENQLVKDFEIKELISHGTFYGFNNDNSGAYRPVSMVYYALVYKLGNGKSGLFHFLSVLIYAILGLLVFELLFKLFSELNPYLALSITVLFISLPIHTEVVANIKSIDEILCMFFGLLSVLFLLRDKQFSIQNQFLIFLFLMLSVLSKETGVGFVVILGLLAYYQGFDVVFWKKFGVIVLALLCYLLIRNLALDSAKTSEMLLINNSLVEIKNVSELFFTKVYILALYFFKCIYIGDFSWDYSFGAIPTQNSINIIVLCSIAVLLVSIFYFFKSFKTNFQLSLGIAWFWILLLPASNLIFLIEATFAERFAFIPSLGICILLLAIINQVKVSLQKPAMLLIFVLSIFNSYQSFSRAKVWKNDLTISFADAYTSGSVRCKMAYASELFTKSEQNSFPDLQKAYLDSALFLAQKAQETMPLYAETNYLLARAYLYLKENEKAKSYYLKTIALDSVHVKSLNDLGVICGQSRDFKESLKYFEKVIQITPNDVKATENAGVIASYLNDLVLAKKYFEKALKLNPNSEIAKKYLVEIEQFNNKNISR